MAPQYFLPAVHRLRISRPRAAARCPPGGSPTAALEHWSGLDGAGGELRSLCADDDVPAEQHAADDLPGMRERVAWAGGGRAGTGGIGHSGHPGNSPDGRVIEQVIGNFKTGDISKG
jgi:hypothetical protein